LPRENRHLVFYTKLTRRYSKFQTHLLKLEPVLPVVSHQQMLRVALGQATRSYTQATSKYAIQRELLGFQARNWFEGLVVPNRESMTQNESLTSSPLGACLKPHFGVKELGNGPPLHCVHFLELRLKTAL